jgi:hypothetical protein
VENSLQLADVLLLMNLLHKMIDWMGSFRRVGFRCGVNRILWSKAGVKDFVAVVNLRDSKLAGFAIMGKIIF